MNLLQRIACSLAALIALPIASANAQDEDRPTTTSDHQLKKEPHAQLGARLGYGIGAGSVYEGFAVTEGSYGFVPVIVDLGVRVMPQLYVGAYGGYARVVPRHNATSCPEAFSCGIDNYRVGIQADYHFIPRLKLDPYVGLYSGYEILRNHVTGTRPIPTPAGAASGSVDSTVTERGWEFIGATVGADIRSLRALAVGPFLSGSIAQYNDRSGSTTVMVQGNTVSNTDAPQQPHALHTLLMLGARGTLNL